MEQAKNAVKSFIGKSGHHDTVVDESVNPAVTSETVKPHRHEETTQAVDREVHQHHYHTTVQPVSHKEVLPEQHTHQQAPVQEREFTHGDTQKVRSGVEAEAAKFGDTSRTHQTTHSASQAAPVTGEHVHHHVHETVQPVIHKETVQPEVVHTTVPVHEVHHAQAEHHGMSTLPTKTLDEFKSLGGSVVGGSQRHEEYEGHPRPYNPQMQTARSDADQAPAKHDGLHGSHDTSVTGASTGASTGTRNVSNIGDSYSTGTGNTGLTGTALGGRTEGNTTGRALDASHSGVDYRHGPGSATAGSGHTSTGTTGANTGISSAAHNTEQDYGQTARSTGGAATHSDSRNIADTSASNTANTGNTSGHAHGHQHGSADDVQTPDQGKDPSLVENKSSGKWVGEGVDGSHSAVFGLTPDGHRHQDTGHGVSALRPAHTKDASNTSTTTGSREAAGSGVAEQMHDLKVGEKGHGGSATSNTGSAKPGAGAPGGEQGFGNIRPEQHGAEAKISNKLDPTTDADGDGKRGLMD